MNFVQWIVALTLLVVVLGGSYGGITTLLSRRVAVAPYTVEGRGAIAVAILYLAGSLAALIASLLLFLLK